MLNYNVLDIALVTDYKLSLYFSFDEPPHDTTHTHTHISSYICNYIEANTLIAAQIKWENLEKEINLFCSIHFVMISKLTEYDICHPDNFLLFCNIASSLHKNIIYLKDIFLYTQHII